MDLISRQAVLDQITESINQFGGRYTTDQLNMLGLFTRMICDLPSAQPEHEYTMEEFVYGQDMGNPEDGSL